jgi:hypothetical protein
MKTGGPRGAGQWQTGNCGVLQDSGGDAVNHIRLNKSDVIREIEANHFRLVSEREQIQDSQYMVILEKD